MAPKRSAGYGRPPVESRFRPGKSGNPKGRPKGSLNLAAVLASELGERITVRENGKSRRVSKQAALVKALIAKALQGDTKAIGTVLMLSGKILGETSTGDETVIPSEELRVLKRYAQQILTSGKGKRH